MKKSILALSIALTSVFALSAQAPAANDSACGNHAEKKGCAKGSCSKDKAKACNPFEGLSLTEQQQAAIKAIPCPKDAMKAARKACAKDSTKECSHSKAPVNPKELRANYLQEVKKVLSADQYVQFLENNFTNQPAPKAKGMKHCGKHKHAKDGKHANCKKHGEGEGGGCNHDKK